MQVALWLPRHERDGEAHLVDVLPDTLKRLQRCAALHVENFAPRLGAPAVLIKVRGSALNAQPVLADISLSETPHPSACTKPSQGIAFPYNTAQEEETALVAPFALSLFSAGARHDAPS